MFKVTPKKRKTARPRVGEGIVTVTIPARVGFQVKRKDMDRFHDWVADHRGKALPHKVPFGKMAIEI